jgi:hypothetical protein
MLQTVLEDHHKELVPEISAQLAEVVKVMKTLNLFSFQAAEGCSNTLKTE